MAAGEGLQPCAHCGSCEAPRVLAFGVHQPGLAIELSEAIVQVVCAKTADGCGAAGPATRAPAKRFGGLSQGVGLQLRPSCPEALEAIAAWNVRADSYRELERVQAAVARQDARWRARLTQVLKPCPN